MERLDRYEMKHYSFVRLAAMVLLILLVPVLVSGRILKKAKFDAAPLEALRMDRPDYVFIGDSMLHSRLDPTVFSQELGGRKVTLLSDNGAGSARWFLFFKNYVVASGVKPKRVFIFFRDRNWNSPEFRTGGRYRDALEATSDSQEPILDYVLEGARHGFKAQLLSRLEQFYPVMTRQGEAADRLRVRAMNLAGIDPGRRGRFEEQMEHAFNIRNLRGDLGAEMGEEDNLKLERFDSSLEGGFLPHLIALAKAHDIPLVLVRVRRRPNADTNLRYQPDELIHYVESLRAYLASEGVEFYDFTPDTDEAFGMYADGDHIGEKYRPAWTALFTKKLARLLQ